MAEDIRKMADTTGNQAFEKQFEPPHCVLLDSEYCSMGRMVGMLACQQTGYRYYDAATLLEMVPESGITMQDVDAFEAALRYELTKSQILAMDAYPKITAAFDQAIGKALANGPCLIHDRASRELVEGKGYACLRVLTYAVKEEDKIARARLSPLYRGIPSDAEVLRKIREEDNIRANYCMAHSGSVWGRKESYDLCLNTDALGRDYAGALLGAVMTGK